MSTSEELVLVTDLEAKAKSIPLPGTIRELPLFFAEHQSINPDSFAHFEVAAAKMVNSLDEMSESSRVNETKAVLVPVNPGKSKLHHTSPDFLNVMKDQDAYKIKGDEEAPDSQALLDLAYHLTHAEETLDTRRPGTVDSDGFVIMRAEHNGDVVFFVENHLHDESGDYMLLSVASGIPENVLQAQRERERQAEVARELSRVVTRDLEYLDEIDIEQFRQAA